MMLVWDVEHIKGMSELLEQNGYKHFHTEWDTVIPWVKKRTAYGSDEWAKKRERAFSSLLLFKSTTILIPLAETGNYPSKTGTRESRNDPQLVEGDACETTEGKGRTLT